MKSRILLTIALLAICRVSTFVRIPGLDGAALTAHFNGKSADGGLLGVNPFNGDALGIMPYISAAIVIQLLIAVIVAFNKRARQAGHNPAR